MKNKVISCGFILKYKDLLFTVHPTNSDHLSIPKGIVDGNETYFNCAKRELKEETDIDLYTLEWYTINNLGIFEYLKYKDLFLIEVDLKNKIDISKCNCNSYFITKNGKKYKEVDYFKWINFNDYSKMFNISLTSVFDTIYG